ncbi:RNA polymerase sigma factor [Kitasatospora xanthocidica]|uniref:RNA polymerase sigma factor n=1 Tax=Kitasatospora xanthocidica TaxID=83382 RepID=UPI0019BA56FD|nr:sigma-70 family RNA polymerase sigma factor [Kitasatospora xanthocidica]GHF86259.1 RNA polymerase sigma factor [Kitasatospora xanthocidica]
MAEDGGWPGADVVAAAQRGDARALTGLVTASHPHVRRFAHSLCASREDAGDAAQEALTVLYRRVGMLRASTALASWLFRIVRNECLRGARSVLRPHPAGPGDGGATGDGDGGLGGGAGGAAGLASAEEEVLRRLEARRIAEALAALPPDQRRVLVLRDVRGRSGRAVAEELGIGQAAMKSRLHRARAALGHSLSTAPAGAGVPAGVPVAAGGRVR